MNKRLKLLQVLLKLLSIPQAPRTNTGKRQILSRTQLLVAALATGEVFAAAYAGLPKSNFAAQDAGDSFSYLFDVVKVFN